MTSHGGWATYHHGRGSMTTATGSGPLRLLPPSRSWWRPAIVHISIFNNNVCWYPLVIDALSQHNGHNGGHHTQHASGVKPTRRPAASSRYLRAKLQIANGEIKGQAPTAGKPIKPDRIPPTGVVTMESKYFG